VKAIRASEVGSYLYCRRAWWYRRHGQPSANQAEMEAGTALHAQHGRQVRAAGTLQGLGFASLFTACILLTAFALFYLLSA